MRQIKILTKMQLKSLFGINVLRFSKDKSAKGKAVGLIAVYTILICLLSFYMGMATYGYIKIGLDEVIFPYLVTLSSLFVFLLSIFKASGILFQKNSHDILCSLPLSDKAIVISRFIQMYLENLILTLAIMLPGIIVYGAMLSPSPMFYVLGLIATIFVPLLPLSIASFVGALITAIASRSRRKNLVSTVLSLVLIVGVFILAAQGETVEENISIDTIKDISDTILKALKHIFPPAFYIGNAVKELDFLQFIVWELFACLFFFITITIISKNFRSICRNLYSTSAKHDYELKHLEKCSVLMTLAKRELKHYFSSSIYVTNTIIGPLLSLIFSITLLVIGTDSFQKEANLPFEIDEIIPFVLAATFCIMPVTSSSISIEGKEWWLVKSLPISTKDLLDAKLLFNLILLAPFYFISEIMLILAIKPSLIQLLWLVLVPLVLILFSLCFGLTINLKFPVFDWTSEVTVVKQSTASIIGGIGIIPAIVVFSAPTFLVPCAYRNLTNALICSIVLIITFFMYRKNNTINLQEL